MINLTPAYYAGGRVAKRFPPLFPVLAIALLGGAMDVKAVVKNYNEETALFGNPERGFHHVIDPLFVADRNGPALDSAFVAGLRREHVTLVHRKYTWVEYLNRPLGASFLDLLQADFAAVRKAGSKLQVRFSYANNITKNGDEATLDLVLEHLRQVKPILHANADVLSLAEAGIIGYWGEWHDSHQGFLGGKWGELVIPTTLEIMRGLMDAVPVDRKIVIRYTHHIQQLLGDSTSKVVPGVTFSLPEAQAHGNSWRARIGFHNDAFHYDGNSDFGSWDERPAIRESEKRYINDMTVHSPGIGEPASDGDWSLNNSPLPELERLHFASLSLNQNDAGGLYSRWKQNGTEDSLHRRLGYRFVLLRAESPDSVRRGDTLALKIKLVNAGFRSPYNARRLEVILRSHVDGKVMVFDVTHSRARALDPRYWLRENGEMDLSIGVPTQSLSPGRYEVLLNLPDTSTRLRDRPEYSIRLANLNMWEPGSGFNKLGFSLEVLSPGSTLHRPGRMFKPVSGRRPAWKPVWFHGDESHDLGGRRQVGP